MLPKDNIKILGYPNPTVGILRGSTNCQHIKSVSTCEHFIAMQWQLTNVCCRHLALGFGADILKRTWIVANHPNPSNESYMWSVNGWPLVGQPLCHITWHVTCHVTKWVGNPLSRWTSKKIRTCHKACWILIVSPNDMIYETLTTWHIVLRVFTVTYYSELTFPLTI